jgi:hypothetical protein
VVRRLDGDSRIGRCKARMSPAPREGVLCKKPGLGMGLSGEYLQIRPTSLRDLKSKYYKVVEAG